MTDFRLHIGSLIEINLERPKPSTLKNNNGEIVGIDFNSFDLVDKIRNKYGLVVKDLSHLMLSFNTFSEIVDGVLEVGTQVIPDNSHDSQHMRFYKNFNIITKIDFLYIPLSDEYDPETYKSFFETSLKGYIINYFKTTLGYLPAITIHKCFDPESPNLTYQKIEENSPISAIVRGLVKINEY